MPVNAHLQFQASIDDGGGRVVIFPQTVRESGIPFWWGYGGMRGGKRRCKRDELVVSDDARASVRFVVGSTIRLLRGADRFWRV